ncbi:MAG: cation:proton antiporter [Lishizhenia sp.]
MNPYLLIMAASTVIILSFFFNIIAKKTNIPSVLMLIILGVVIKESFGGNQLENEQYHSILEVLGNVGLVMIVLEAALDLKLEKEKAKMILASFLVALVALAGSTLLIAYLFQYMFPDAELYTRIVYAVPLSIMSSAIIIPSVGGLTGVKKEFMVYESTFSDILGIMVFYFLIGADSPESTGGSVALDILINIGITIALSVFVAYSLVFLFQHLKMQVKLFLIIGVLMLLFAAGKFFHLSSLLIILAFGLVLNNTDIFFRGYLAKHFDTSKVKPILHDFHILTLESAFIIRTFFFVIFGMSITLASFYDLNVFINSLAIVGVLYAVRYITLLIFARKNIFPELFIAPRGLITILLFFVVTNGDQFNIPNFDPGLLLYPILITSIIMTISLISYRGEKVKDVLLPQLPLKRKDKDNNGKNDEYQERIIKNVEGHDFDGF